MNTPPSLSPKASWEFSRPLFWVNITIIAVLIGILIGFLSANVIRSIDDLLGAVGLSDFAIIFSALDTAELEVHIALPTVIAFLFCIFISVMARRGGEHRQGRARRIALTVFVGLLLFLFSLLVSIWLTEVNDIRFGTVLISLLNNMDALAGL